MKTAQALTAYAFGGSTMTMLLPGAETGGAFALVHIRKGAGSSTPMHLHDAETEISYVLDGVLGLETPHGLSHLGADEWHVLPPRHAHRLFNDSPTEMHEFLICAPAIFDRFVTASGKPVAPFAEPEGMTDALRQSISKHAPDFGIRLFRETPVEETPPAHSDAAPEILHALGGRFEVLSTLGEQDDALAFLRFTLPPGTTTALTATADRQAFYPVKGQASLYRNDADWEALTPLAAGNVAPGESYALRNDGEAAATVLVVSAFRLVRFLRALDQAARADEPASSEAALKRLAAEHGYRLEAPGFTRSRRA